MKVHFSLLEFEIERNREQFKTISFGFSNHIKVKNDSKERSPITDGSEGVCSFGHQIREDVR